jgi:hypothetical protein
MYQFGPVGPSRCPKVPYVLPTFTRPVPPPPPRLHASPLPPAPPREPTAADASMRATPPSCTSPTRASRRHNAIARIPSSGDGTSQAPHPLPRLPPIIARRCWEGQLIHGTALLCKFLTTGYECAVCTGRTTMNTSTELSDDVFPRRIYEQKDEYKGVPISLAICSRESLQRLVIFTISKIQLSYPEFEHNILRCQAKRKSCSSS